MTIHDHDDPHTTHLLQRPSIIHQSPKANVPLSLYQPAQLWTVKLVTTWNTLLAAHWHVVALYDATSCGAKDLRLPKKALGHQKCYTSGGHEIPHHPLLQRMHAESRYHARWFIESAARWFGICFSTQRQGHAPHSLIGTGS